MIHDNVHASALASAGFPPVTARSVAAPKPSATLASISSGSTLSPAHGSNTISKRTSSLELAQMNPAPSAPMALRCL
ncbi:hypothetical protein BC831DRAFT_468123 [Entophlyctis helioformis]|nr:hypothetical protein BC831DRAFT_468123 [Entophlyctis helioformis]